MADGDQRLNAIFQALVSDLLIERQPCLVGLLILAGGENARPGNREAAALEAHLGKEGNVLFSVVVVVNGDPSGVIGVSGEGVVIQLTLHHLHPVQVVG